MLDKKWYTDKKCFEFEINNIFKEQWIFAGLVNDLKNNNDFITLEVGKSSVVVQNFKGSLVAFQNICSHRLKRIQTEEKGNRPFFCEYHGWNYDKDGVPRIPKVDTFEINESNCLKLKKYELDICGKFIFIKINNNNSLSLRDYLGEYFDEIVNISSFFDTVVDTDKIYHNSNWKLLVENVLEGYHCPLVHKETFIVSGYCIDSAKEIRFNRNHSSFILPKEKSDADKALNRLTFFDELLNKHESFHHIYIYPNLFITSVSGSIYYIGRLKPLSKNRTVLETYFLKPNFNRELTKKERGILKAFLSMNAEYGKKIILEDVSMVESCQKGLEEESDKMGILSKTEEIRILEFHNVLNKVYIEKNDKLI
jgi:phenylpropionate dioxygenase-like ring-hydroxylating dioxygenase large terminal subunit